MSGTEAGATPAQDRRQNQNAGDRSEPRDPQPVVEAREVFFAKKRRPELQHVAAIETARRYQLRCGLSKLSLGVTRHATRSRSAGQDRAGRAKLNV